MGISVHKIEDDDGYAYCWEFSNEVRVDMFPPNEDYDVAERNGFAYYSGHCFYDSKEMRDLAKLLLECADVLDEYREKR